MFGWIKRLFGARKTSGEAFVGSQTRVYGGARHGGKAWRGEMPKPLHMAPPAPYQRDPNWVDPAPMPEAAQPRRLIPNMAPGRHGVVRPQRTTFAPEPTPYNPLTDIASPLNPLSPLYDAIEKEIQK